jgi:hypothetical protein
MRQLTIAALSALSLVVLACGGMPNESAALGNDDELSEPLAPLGGHFFSLPLARGESTIRDFAVDASGVYYVTANAPDPNQPRETLGRVAQVSKRGGFPHVIVAHQRGGGSIASNARSLFWSGAAVDASGVESPALFTRSKLGGPVHRFAASWAGFISGALEQPPYLLADDQQVYAMGDEEFLYRIPIFAQKPVLLAQSADHFAIAQDRDEVFLSEGRNCSSFIAEIRKNAPGAVSQGAPSPFASFIDDESVVCVVWSMAISESTLYWTTIFDGILSAHLNGAPAPADAPQLLLPPAGTDFDSIFAQSARYLTVIPPNLYFTTGDGALKRMATSGGPVTTVVASGVNPDVRISADADSVYWVSAAGDRLLRTRVR